MCKQVPWHTGDARMAWYYYDGVRRVQEVFRDPLPPGSLAGNPNPIGSYTTYTDREYVWGPDYVDECLWQVDRTGAAAFVLQDANFNVVALIDETGQVLQQFDYDPYGSVRELDELAAYADNRIGFQGLFADRHDTDAPNPETALGAFTTSYARNRDYRPDPGRWMQRDPNGSGQALLTDLGITTAIGVSNSESMFLDGPHLFAAWRSAPPNHGDPYGLFAAVAQLQVGGIRGFLAGLGLPTLSISGGSPLAQTMVWGNPLAMEYIGATLIGGATLATAHFGDDLLEWLGIFTAGASSDRPAGVPDSWPERDSKKGGGRVWTNPDNPHDNVRRMPGNPHSPNPSQKRPYVQRMKDGRARDKNNNPVDPNSPEAHIPEDQFVFYP